MFKTANVGQIDRAVRLSIGAVLIALPFVFDSPLWKARSRAGSYRSSVSCSSPPLWYASARSTA